MNSKKQKLSNSTFRKILIPILSVITMLALLANIACMMLSSTLDTYLGRGETVVSTPTDPNGLDGIYYTKLYTNNNESTEAAYQVAKQVAEEGSILLKNNGILPLSAGGTVMPFGYAYLSPIYGQLSAGGSAKWVVDPVTPEQGLDAFTIDHSAVDLMRAAPDPAGLSEATGTISAGDAGSVLGGDCKIYEYDPSIFAALSPVGNATGIVFITRSGQEGQDQKFDAYADGTPHYLALSENEKGTIRAAKAACGQVVVILVSSAPMELAPLMGGELEADAILWIGHPGERGFATLSDLLDGAVNPSGRTVDTYVYDFTKDPTYQNLGSFSYSNLSVTRPGTTPGSGDTFQRMYTEYQEGVYMGYRYYETADFMDDSFVYGELDGRGAFVTEGAVCYPFGYGLSYTTFQQELLGATEQDGQVTVRIEVTNTGAAAGKEVVQLYYTAPYTDLDIQYKIEKPVVNLIAFGKTGLLEPGASETVDLTFAMEDMATYCYTHQNDNGTVGCYMLEEGDYIISLRSDSHDVIAQAAVTQPATIWYDGSDEAHIRDRELDAQSALDHNGVSTGIPAKSEVDPDAAWIAASNQFQTSNDYMNTDSIVLSRADWAGTQPQTVPGRSKEISEQFAAQLGIENTFDVENDPDFGNVEGSIVYAAQAPVSNADNGLTLSEMRGLSYYDGKWEQLLDQIDWDGDKDGIILSFTGAAYVTREVSSIGLPITEEYDGANGLKVKGMDAGYDMTKSSSFGFAPLMAATWNEDLLYEVGVAFGQESLQNNINGWYCPAINLHRSPFSGRVFEYYSEDPILSGKLAARVISGAGDQGMFCYVKHFALNDTETGRDRLSNYWADEQTMRELYLRPFEIAIEEARMTIGYYDESGALTEKTMRAATAVMPAQNCVGTTVGHANYPLLNNILRGEWGFQGVVVSDYWVWSDDNLRDLCLRTGCDTYLCMQLPIWSLVDYDSPTARSVMRNALHNLCYTVANSNAMQGYAPGTNITEITTTTMSPWMKVLITADVAVGLLVLGGVIWIIVRTIAEKKHPEQFKPKRSKKNQQM